MLQKIFTREVKVALMVISALVLFYFGMNYLKGLPLFGSNNFFYAKYTTAVGLQPSNPVYIKGYKVGQVVEIQYDFARDTAFVVKISVQKDVKLPKGTSAELFDDGLMGGKAIQLNFSQSPDFHEVGDTLSAERTPELLDLLKEQILTRLSFSLDNLDSLVQMTKLALSDGSLKNSIASIEKITSDLSVSAGSFRKVMVGDVPKIVANIDSISGDLKTISGDISQIKFDSLVQKVDTTLVNLQQLSAKINSSDGTLGLLLHDKSVYNSLETTINSANSLLQDLKENPKRYVHFSLFGKSEKKKK